MTRYPTTEHAYLYYCADCGYQLPEFQGAFWFVRERTRGDGTVDVPYCPKCGTESITVTRT